MRGSEGAGHGPKKTYLQYGYCIRATAILGLNNDSILGWTSPRPAKIYSNLDLSTTSMLVIRNKLVIFQLVCKLMNF